MTLRQSRDLGEVSYAPLSALRSQPSVELFVALGGVTTVDLVRTVEVENALGRTWMRKRRMNSLVASVIVL